MGFLTGDPLPNVTETTSTKDVAPTGYTNYLEDLASAGSGALTKMGPEGKPVLKTGADLVAGYDPMQNLGYNQLQTAAGSYQPGLAAAGQTAARAAQGITPDRIQALMNPYTTNVVNEMARLSNQNVERNLLPGMKAGFVGTGGFGSDRYARALGQSMADVQGNLTGAQSGALSAGFSQAMKGALDEAQLQNLTAKTQADIAKQEQELGIAGAGALTKAGAERQKYQQSLLDAPLSVAKEASGLMRGQTIPVDQTKTFVGPKSKDYYQMSDAQRLGNLVTFLGSAAAGSGFDAIAGALRGGAGGESLSNYLSGRGSTLDLGGGIKLGFDPVSGAAFVSGTSLQGDDLVSNEDLLADWGFLQNTEGDWIYPDN